MMAIETLDDVIEEICDALGIYGACDEECDLHDGPYSAAVLIQMCRSHASANLNTRIREAVAVEEKLGWLSREEDLNA